MEAVDGPQELGGEVDLAAVPERGIGFPGDGIDRDEPPAAVQEDPPLAVTVLPQRDSPVHETRPVRHLSPLGDPGVVGPLDFAGVRVEGDDLVVGGADVHHPVTDDRGVLETARPHRVVRHRQPGPAERSLAGIPLPGELQVGHVLPIHLGERGSSASSPDRHPNSAIRRARPRRGSPGRTIRPRRRRGTARRQVGSWGWSIGEGA